VLIPSTPARQTVVLLDTNVIIEAVRTNCWNAVAGALIAETVDECRTEALKGDTTRRGYVKVTEAHLGRLSKIHIVSDTARASFALAYDGAGAMDARRGCFSHTRTSELDAET